MLEKSKFLQNIYKRFFGSGLNSCFGAILSGLLLTFLILGFMMVPAARAAVTIPESGPGLYVLDQAGVLSEDTKSLIINTSQELKRQTKAQVAVVTLKTLNDQPIEDVALGILRDWKLGDKKLNNGLVILVVPSEHKARIEVGYGLEGPLPDAKTGRIQDDYMLPSFQKGNYDQGIRNGYLQIVNAAAEEYGVKLNIKTEQSPTEQPVRHHMPAWEVILLAIGIIMLVWIDNRFLDGFILGMIMGMFFRGGGFGGGGGGFGGGSDSGGGGSGGGGGSSRGW